MKRVVSVILMLCLAGAALPAFAATIELNGSVVSDVTQVVYSNYGGTVDQVLVREGQRVSAGEVLAVLKTDKVYAKESGTVYLFGSVGDDAVYASEIYGGVAWLEPDIAYTVTGSVKYAYDGGTGLTVHPGEAVSLSTVDGVSFGRGIITTAADNSFDVLVTTPGSLSAGDTVYIYRGPGGQTADRIGRGSVVRRGPYSYTAEGVIVSYAVSSGQKVGKGSLLFETLSGTYRGETGDLTLIKAPADGVIASLSVSAGSAVAEGAQIASFYPAAGLRVEAFASESDLAGFRRGDPVQVEMIYAENVDKLLTGKVEYISVLGTAEAAGESDEAAYAVCVVLDAVPDSIAYGMSAIVTAAGRTAAADEPPAEEAAPEAGD